MVLGRIKPTYKESLAELRFAKELVKKVQKVAPAGCDVELTGSIAKGTYLRDSRDIDIFVLFPKSRSKKSFESIIEKIVKKAFPKVGYQLSYAEHPYARLHYEGRKIDLVPAYSIKKADERLSAVDRSVLHTKYVLKNMSKKQKDDVLLLKKLLKANGLYGAEIKIEGFPGYLCELLILKYESFPSLINTVSKWALPIVIDIKGFYKTKKERLSLPHRFDTELVVIDPTDKNRNVAAAISAKNLRKFILLCKYFKRNPRDVFFFRNPKTFEQKVKYLKAKGPAYVITLPKPNIVDDVLWGQLKKLMHQLKLHLEQDGFELCIPGPVADDTDGKIRIAFSVVDNYLPKTMAVEGPPLDMEKHRKAFKKKHKGAKFIERSDHVFAITKRKIRKPAESVNSFFTKLKKSGKSHLAYPLSRIRFEKY
jgi:tRNA nucleotidyltransferase (CCA-adding enzyme)